MLVLVIDLYSYTMYTDDCMAWNGKCHPDLSVERCGFVCINLCSMCSLLCEYPYCIIAHAYTLCVCAMLCVSIVKIAAALTRMGKVYRKERERLVSSFYRPAHVDLVQERFLHTCPQGMCVFVCLWRGRRVMHNVRVQTSICHVELYVHIRMCGWQTAMPCVRVCYTSYI